MLALAAHGTGSQWLRPAELSKEAAGEGLSQVVGDLLRAPLEFELGLDLAPQLLVAEQSVAARPTGGIPAQALMEVAPQQAGQQAVGQLTNMMETGTNRLNQVGPFRFCYLMPGTGAERGSVHDGDQLVAVR